MLSFLDPTYNIELCNLKLFNPLLFLSFKLIIYLIKLNHLLGASSPFNVPKSFQFVNKCILNNSNLFLQQQPDHLQGPDGHFPVQKREHQHQLVLGEDLLEQQVVRGEDPLEQLMVQ